jgi:CheY-like chemotaxis protein
MNQKTVLVVEDDATVSRCLGLILELGGYRVLHAQNGLEALRFSQIHNDSIDLVLCDVLLPGESGASVAASLRQFSPNNLVLFLSGYPFDILVERRLLDRNILQDGATFFLQKPFVAGDLLREIARILDTRSSRRTLRHATAAY